MKKPFHPALIILGIVLVAGFVFAIPVFFLGSSDSPVDAIAAVPAGPTVEGIVHGEFTADLDRRLEKDHPWHSGALAVLTTARYAILRDVPDLVVGRDGLLFTTEEVARTPVEDTVLDERLALIVQLSREVERQGATPLVVLLPTKARIYNEYLPRRFRLQAQHPRFESAIALLESESIAFIDIRSGLRSLPPGEGFFRRDTHWTPTGAAVAARAVARVVSADPVSRHLVGAPRTRYEPLPGQAIQVPGDLMNFLPVGDFREFLGLPIEQAVQPRFSRETAEIGLFDALEVPLLLVGTSYSADERWAFDLQIGFEVSFDILNLSEEGRGPFDPMERLLADELIGAYNARLVIWEIPERYLTIDIP